MLYFTAAAAFSSMSQAWMIPPSLQSQKAIQKTIHPAFPSPPVSNLDGSHFFSHKPQNGATRRYFSSRRDDDEGKGLLSKIGKAVKSVLPTKLFGSDEEKRKLQRRKEVGDQVSGGLTEILKDAPLGVRMIGKMISPLMRKVASSLAETMAAQQRTTEALLDDARGYLMRDPDVTRLLGEPISVGTPFSQSSSTTSINGKTQSRVELGVPVSGSIDSGVARLFATQDGISQLQVEAGGRTINVSLSKQQWSSSSSRGSFSSRSDSDDNIIEAEIIDKKSND
jgi:hypothetical protein